MLPWGVMGFVIRELVVAPGESPSLWALGFLRLKTIHKVGERKGGLFFCIHLKTGAGGGGSGGGSLALRLHRDRGTNFPVSCPI